MQVVVMKYASKFSMHNLVEEEWKQIQLDPNFWKLGYEINTWLNIRFG